VLFLILDLGVQTRLSGPTTVYYNILHKEVKTYFKSLPNNFVQGYNHYPFKQLNDTQGLKTTNGIWQNVATFNKTISSVAYNPIHFSNYDKSIDNGALDRNLENELLFFPTKEFHANDTLQKGYIWNTLTKIQTVERSTTVENVTVDYNSFSAQVNNTANVSQWLILNQNYHHLWKAYYNEKEISVVKVNEMVMGVEIPKNTNGKIKFVYDSPLLIYSILISILSYLTILLLWFLNSRKSVVV
jgi:hypothetical protein